MFELKFKKITFTFDFSFFSVITLMLLSGNSSFLQLCFLTCIWHEAGHIFMMLLNNVGIKKICFYGAGIKIIPDKIIDIVSLKTNILILSAGCLLNFVTAAVFWNSNSDLLYNFAVINSFIGAFNIFPLQFLDGGRIIVTLIRHFCTYQCSVQLERFIKWLNIILIIVVLITISIVGKCNISLFITLCCLIFSAITTQ